MCHHGRVKVNGEVGCECDRGWTSERIRTRGFVHNMCNVRGSTAPQPVLQTSVSVNSVVMVPSCLHFSLYVSLFPIVKCEGGSRIADIGQLHVGKNCVKDSKEEVAPPSGC